MFVKGGDIGVCAVVHIKLRLAYLKLLTRMQYETAIWKLFEEFFLCVVLLM